MKPIKGVIFDIDGTMYSQTLLRSIIGFHILGKLLFSFPGTLKSIKIISAFRHALEDIRKHDGNYENLTEVQIEMTSKMTGETKENIRKVVDYWIYKKPLNLLNFCKRNGLNEIFPWLKKKEIKIGVFSDYPCHDKCITMGVYDNIDAFVSSVDKDVGAFKPNKKGFLITAEKLGLEPENILFIGDRVALDLEGAASAGMQTFLLPAKLFSKTIGHPSSHSIKGLKKFLKEKLDNS